MSHRIDVPKKKAPFAKRASTKLLVKLGAGGAAVLATILAINSQSTVVQDAVTPFGQNPVKIDAGEGPPTGVDYVAMSTESFNRDIRPEFPGGKTSSAEAAGLIIAHPHRLLKTAINMTISNQASGDVRIVGIHIEPRTQLPPPNEVMLILGEQGGSGHVEGTTYLAANFDKPLEKVREVDEDGKVNSRPFFPGQTVLLEKEQSIEIQLDVSASASAGTFAVIVDYSFHGESGHFTTPESFHVSGLRCTASGQLPFRDLFSVSTDITGSGEQEYRLKNIARKRAQSVLSHDGFDLSSNGC